MSEQFDDVALSRALKQGTEKALDGWEFTPAMSARVLDRIRADEAGVSAPSGRPDRRFKPAPVLRPLAWVAVAAAATVLAINTGIPFGGSSKMANPPSKASIESAQTAGATPNPSDPAAQDLAQGAGSAQKTPVGAPITPRSEDDTNRVNQSGGVASLETAQVTLFTPPAKEGQSGNVGKKPDDAKMAVAAVASTNQAMAGTDRSWVVLQDNNVVGLSDSAEPLWSRPIEHLGPDSVLAVARDGRVAVGTASGHISILATNGDVERTIKASVPIRKLVWSEDGRLASLEEKQIHVYGPTGDALQFSVDVDPNSDMTFSPEGTLAVFGDQPDGPGMLKLVDRTGHVTLKARPDTGGRGVAWAAGGTVVVAGGRGFAPTDKLLWTAPIKPQGTLAFGENMVVLWDDHSVAALDARDGHVVWQATHNAAGEVVHRVVPSADGRHVAIIGKTADGQGALWVLDSAGAVKYSEHLAELPLDLTWAGGKMLLMYPQSLSVTTLP